MLGMSAIVWANHEHETRRLEGDCFHNCHVSEIDAVCIHQLLVRQAIVMVVAFCGLFIHR